MLFGAHPADESRPTGIGLGWIKAMGIRKNNHPRDPYPNNDLPWMEISHDPWPSFLEDSDRLAMDQDPSM